MPKYNWRCQICESSVQKDNEYCTTCGSPAEMNASQIETIRNNWQAHLKSKNKGPYECLKCGHGSFHHGQIRTSGGDFSAVTDIDNRRFTHITCNNCGYTEFYKSNVSTVDKIVDFLYD